MCGERPSERCFRPHAGAHQRREPSGQIQYTIIGRSEVVYARHNRTRQHHPRTKSCHANEYVACTHNAFTHMHKATHSIKVRPVALHNANGTNMHWSPSPAASYRTAHSMCMLNIVRRHHSHRHTPNTISHTAKSGPFDRSVRSQSASGRALNGCQKPDYCCCC